MSVSDPTPQGSSDDVVGFAVIPNWLLRDARVGHHAKMLWAYLSSRAGRDGVSWPSQDLIAQETGMSRATVQRALVDLRALGLVSVEVLPTPTGRRNRYVLHSHLQGGSHQGDAMGRITERREEEPSEEEPSTPPPPTTESSSGPAPLSQRRTAQPDRRRGKMTSSWRVSSAAGKDAVARFPNLNHKREMETFRDWHIGQDSPARTQMGWDSMFLAWCARKQDQYEKDHPGGTGVERDDITGMPINPKPRP